MSGLKRKFFEKSSPILEKMFNLGHLRLENLENKAWTLTLESFLLFQFLFNFFWLEITIYPHFSRWFLYSLGICSFLLEIFTKLIHLKKIQYRTKRLLISIAKLCNTILLMTFFVLIFEKMIYGEKHIDGKMVFNLITNYVITVTSLAFAYMSWGYIMIIFFFSFILISSIGFEANIASNGGVNNTIAVQEENQNCLFCSNILSFIILTILMRKLTCSWELINKILEDASVGKAIVKSENKEFIFFNESLSKIIGKPKIDIKFENINSLKFSRVLKVTDHPSILFHNTESESPLSPIGLQRTNINFILILDFLKKNPSKVLTLYTTVGNEVINYDLPGKSRLKNQCINSFFQTEGNFFEPEIKYIEVKVSYLDWGRFKDRYVYIQMNDVSELKKFMDTERQNEFKTKVLHSFSHELKTPINISRNMLDLMIMEERMPEVLKENYASVVRESIDHLDFLIQDIIDFLKIESYNFQLHITKFSLKTLLEEVVSTMLKKFGEREIQVFLKTDSNDEYIISTDRSRLKRVFLNVLSYFVSTNIRCILEFTIKGNQLGSYDFLLEREADSIKEKESEPLKLITKSKGLMSTLSVHPENDFGILISRSLLAKLKGDGIESYHFDIEPKDGVIMKMTTTAYYDDSPIHTFEPSIGKLELNSYRLQDSSLLKLERRSLTLNSNRRLNDLSPTNIDFKIKSNSNIFETISKCPRVLIVDDDSFNLLSINLLLEKMNLVSLKASNGVEAIANLTNFHKEHKCMNENCRGIEVIIMDIMMPVMNGLECAKILINMMAAGEIPQIPIIACTANDSKDVYESCNQIGFKEMLSKPITLNTLRNVVSPLILS